MSTIRALGITNQQLLSYCLDIGLINEARKLQEIDKQLIRLLGYKSGFDFVSQLAAGITLLVGEGNFSFSLSLSRMERIISRNLITTTYEYISDLSTETQANAEKLKFAGATVICGVDATKLSETFGSMRFNNIVFQFPHVGSREAIEGHNPNFILIRDFLKSASHQLESNGRVYISAVDSPHYQGAFQFDEAAAIAGFQPPELYPFEPSEFPEYNHTMTNEGESALDNHDKFGTWVFEL